MWTFCDGAITVEDTPVGYRAYLTDLPSAHEVGMTQAVAVGNLIVAHEDALVAILRTTRLVAMTQAEAEALAAAVAATPGYTVTYTSERTRGWVVVVQTQDDHGSAITFTLHSHDEWERRRPPVIVQPALIMEDRHV